MVMESTRSYPQVRLGAPSRAVASGAGLMLVTQALAATGLDSELEAALDRWELNGARHRVSKVLTDLALMLVAGGDCLSDVALLRGQDVLFGPVASDPVISRTITRLAKDVDQVTLAVNQARAKARRRAWRLAGPASPDSRVSATHPLVIDLDATLVRAHSDKEGAKPTWKHSYGFHPLTAFIDHGPDGSGEPAGLLLRPGNAGSNTASDHIALVEQALKQLPAELQDAQARDQVLIRTDSGGATHQFIDWLSRQGLAYSIGFPAERDWDVVRKLALIPDQVWQPAINPGGQTRDGAWVAEATLLLNLKGWPKDMRVIVRKEHPHPGAQTCLFDLDGMRITAFVTNTRVGQLSALELRHRQRARCEDRIRCAKDTGLTNLPLYSLAQNQIWCLIVQLACDLIAWTGMLTLAGTPARRWEPKRLRYRLLTLAAAITTHARMITLRYATSPWTRTLTSALHQIRALPATT